MKTSEEAGERTEVLGATHSLTRVWTLGWLEAGCFLFSCSTAWHSVQNGVNMIKGHNGRNSTAREYSTSISPPPRSQHLNIKYAKTDPGRVSLKAPQCKSRLCAIGWVGPRCSWFRSGQSPRTNPRVPHWSRRRWFQNIWQQISFLGHLYWPLTRLWD